MELRQALNAHKREILSLWIERTLDSYLSSTFFKTTSDPFANPVGACISQGLTALFTLLVERAQPETWYSPLDEVVRIRAVQDFSPSKALAPVLELKWVVKQVLSKQEHYSSWSKALDAFDCEVDRMALAAFDIYSACKEQLYRNRLREITTGASILTDARCASRLGRLERHTEPPSEE